MITKDEIKSLAHGLGLSPTTIEKDYVLGWILHGIASHPTLQKIWAFKGGTCLRKCYYQHYRFSEDLDFTILDQNFIQIGFVEQALAEVSNWVSKKSGIEIDLERTIFEQIRNTADQTIIQGRLYYRGPVSPTSLRQWPRIKFDLTADEKIVLKPVCQPIFHSYSDQTHMSEKILCYPLLELFAEKIRALFERTRPRDLYDVVELHKTERTLIEDETLVSILKAKCLYKKLPSLAFESLKLEACQSGWEKQLAHQLPKLPAFQDYVSTFKEMYEKMEFWKLTFLSEE